MKYRKTVLTILLALCLSLLLCACVKKDASGSTKSADAVPAHNDTDEDLETYAEYEDSDEDYDPNQATYYDDSEENLG